ncbi:hypothetical protein [Streptomyces coelicoflavus]|nr:hypothetical protein [Streptomyces coelicoflavus]
MERTDQQQPQPSPTPVTQDVNASAAELQQRAANDYAVAQAAREAQGNRR